MYAGQILEESDRSSELFDDPRHPYTLALLNAHPALAPLRTTLTTMRGGPFRLPAPGPPVAGSPPACRSPPIECTGGANSLAGGRIARGRPVASRSAEIFNEARVLESDSALLELRDVSVRSPEPRSRRAGAGSRQPHGLSRFQRLASSASRVRASRRSRAPCSCCWPPTAGRIVFDGRDITTVAIKARRFAIAERCRWSSRTRSGRSIRA